VIGNCSACWFDLVAQDHEVFEPRRRMLEITHSVGKVVRASGWHQGQGLVCTASGVNELSVRWRSALGVSAISGDLCMSSCQGVTQAIFQKKNLPGHTHTKRRSLQVPLTVDARYVMEHAVGCHPLLTGLPICFHARSRDRQRGRDARDVFKDSARM
jgi:hypothetical protein